MCHIGQRIHLTCMCNLLITGSFKIVFVIVFRAIKELTGSVSVVFRNASVIIIEAVLCGTTNIYWYVTCMCCWLVGGDEIFLL